MKNTSIILFVFLLSCTTQLFSQVKELDVKKENGHAPDKGMQKAKLIADLVEHGYTNNSSISLINAAEMLINMPLRDLKLEEGREEDPKNETIKISQKSNSKNYDLDADKLLEDATTMANGDQNILDLVDQTKTNNTDKTRTTRGAYYGPQTLKLVVGAEGRKYSYITFDGREYAEVMIYGDGDNDLDLYIYDSKWNLVAKNEDYTDKCSVSFYPLKTQQYIILVKNRGDVYSNYLLLTN